MTTRPHPFQALASEARSDGAGSVLTLGAIVSVIQAGLFVVIGVAGLVLSVDRLVDDGFASLPGANPTAFRVLCAAFVLIAVLGLAITAAEQLLVEPANLGLARFGAVLAYLGHCATILFFSWWLIRSFDDGGGGIDLDVVAPIDWGVMFELVFVGAWVWIIAALIYRRPPWPQGFVALSVAKAASFWLTFVAFVTDEKWAIVLGLGTVTFVTGPLWHLWIPRLFLQAARGRADER